MAVETIADKENDDVFRFQQDIFCTNCNDDGDKDGTDDCLLQERVPLEPVNLPKQQQTETSQVASKQSMKNSTTRKTTKRRRRRRRKCDHCMEFQKLRSLLPRSRLRPSDSQVINRFSEYIFVKSRYAI